MANLPKVVQDVVSALALAVDKIAAMKFLSFTGRNLAGAITVTGLAVGDRVVGINSTTDGGSSVALFESTVTVANELQQSSATDLSTKKYTILVIPA